MDADYPLVTDPLKLERGDIEAGLAAAPLRLKGEMRIGGQDHFISKAISPSPFPARMTR
jgi:xanthine dehydrogenase large subunit